MVAPLLTWASARLGRRCAIPADFLTPLVIGLATRLLSLALRTLTLEVNAARLRQELHGDSPEARFNDFGRTLARRDARVGLLEAYPVLARDLAVACGQWLDASSELLDRLDADRDAIRSTFCQDPGSPVDIVPELGDRHRHGRSVSLVRFASGLALIYKPRPVAVDASFQTLFTWLNAHGATPALPARRILDRGHYGWIEYVQAQPCSDRHQISRFYRRLGSLAAVLYALRVTDLHFENVIASGEDPCLVDLEAALQWMSPTDAFAPAGEAARVFVSRSVLACGLFPSGPPAPDLLHVSGVENLASHKSPAGALRLERAGTDEMQFVGGAADLPPSPNVPRLGAEFVDPAAHADDIAEGFGATYRLIAHHRAVLLADGGLLSRFRHSETRVILRPTRTYELLLTECRHPATLRDALDRSRVLESLSSAPLGHPGLDVVLRSEVDALARGDVPMFSVRADSRTLLTEAGAVPEFVEASGWDGVRDRLAALSEDDLARQLWLVRASMATLDSGGAALVRSEPTTSAPSADFLSQARAIGDRLLHSAIRGAGDISWIGLQTSASGRWSVRPLGADLYDGLPGVILFLAQLGRLTAEPKYAAHAHAALRALRRDVESWAPENLAIGAFTGWGGLLYAYTHLGALWPASGLLDDARAVVERLPPLIERDALFDLMSGSAGCILVLRRLHSVRPSAEVVESIRLAAEHLLAHAVHTENGLIWENRYNRALSGLSHGAAGLAWALAEAADLTHDSRFAQAAQGALRHERSLYSPAERNWRDVRAAGSGTAMVAWCNGAPGIALARMHMPGHPIDTEIRAHMEVALDTTAAHTRNSNDSLCHGAMGNIDVLLHAGTLAPDPRWSEAIRAMLPARDRWICGTPLGVESPGLMTGLAGIGYQFLRLADPRRVPSILALSPPS